MKKITKLFLTLALLCVAGVANAVEYEIDQKFKSVNIEGKFCILNEAESKALCFTDNHNLNYELYATAFASKGFLFALESAQGESVGNYYYIRTYKQNGELYAPWGGGYLNSQPGNGVSFTLGLNDQNGQDGLNCAVWDIQYVENQGFSIKNINTGKYLKDGGSAHNETPTYFTFCTIKEKVVEDTEDLGVEPCPEGWTDMIKNGTLSGTDVSSFYVGSGNTNAPIVINTTAGRVGGPGIKITSRDDATKNWDTQFWIVANDVMAAGTKVHIEFDYKAGKAGKIETQFHATPGNHLYNCDEADHVTFSLNWQHYERDFLLKRDGVKSFAFNLNEVQNEAIDFYFDNIVMWAKPNAVEKGTYDAVDANTTAFANFGPIAADATYDAETSVFTKNCGWKWDGDGLDLSAYRYIVITAGHSRDQAGDGYMYIKDKNGLTIGGDEYGENYQNMWFSTWNHLFCCKIDLEKLRAEQEFDLHHITELGIDGGANFVLGTAYATNKEPQVRNRWGQGEEGSVRITQGVEDDKFGTICLPYQAAVACAKIYEIASANANGVSLKEHKGLMDAGKPYFYCKVPNAVKEYNDNGQPKTTENKVFFYQATAATVENPVVNNGLVGTFAETTAPTDALVLSGNKLYTVNSTVTVGANKAYIDLAQVSSSSARGTVFLSFDEATGIKAVSETLNAGKMFDLSGREVAQPTKGIYVVNGKKVIVK